MYYAWDDEMNSKINVIRDNEEPDHVDEGINNIVSRTEDPESSQTSDSMGSVDVQTIPLSHFGMICTATGIPAHVCLMADMQSC